MRAPYRVTEPVHMVPLSIGYATSISSVDKSSHT